MSQYMGGSEEDSGQRASEAAGETAPRFAQNKFYRALASAHRRRLLYYLLDHGDSTVDELTSVLSGWNATTSGTMQTPADRSKIQLRLKHNHLPRLADADLISYDADGSTVHIEPLHPHVKDLLQQSIEAERLVESG